MTREERIVLAAWMSPDERVEDEYNDAFDKLQRLGFRWVRCPEDACQDVVEWITSRTNAPAPEHPQ